MGSIYGVTFASANCDYDLAQALWRGGTCLAVDSIQFGDGTAVLLSGDEPLKSRAMTLTVLRNTTWLALITERIHNSFHSATLLPVCRLQEIEAVYGEHRLRIESGEVLGHGSFGYVAVEVKTEQFLNELWWVAFFSGSNPFDKLSVEDGTLHALSTCGYRYSFPLSEPTNVSIQNREDLMWWNQDKED